MKNFNLEEATFCCILAWDVHRNWNLWFLCKMCSHLVRWALITRIKWVNWWQSVIKLIADILCYVVSCSDCDKYWWCEIIPTKSTKKKINQTIPTTSFLPSSHLQMIKDRERTQRSNVNKPVNNNHNNNYS